MSDCNNVTNIVREVLNIQGVQFIPPPQLLHFNPFTRKTIKPVEVLSSFSRMPFAADALLEI
jgi:hypothetical protein